MEENMNIELNEELLNEFENLENEEQGIQTTFNEDSIEDMNDDSVEIENIGEEDVEGIGATGFSMRTTKPSGNKNYMTTSTGGWSTCIKGNPCDPTATVLSNCVGYASGRFNEIINEARGTTGCTYKTLNCNAENFPERAVAAGLKIGSTPRRGAIICWQKGSLASGDGAGHVEAVERVDSVSKIYTSSSGWGSSNPFWNSTRTVGNGNWGLNSPYKFRCFIYLPDDVQKWVDGTSPSITPTVARDTSKNQLETLTTMNVRTNIETTSPSLGTVPAGSIYNYYEEKQGKSSKWYAITPDKSQWIAGVNNDGTKYCEIYPAIQPTPPQPTPTPTYKYNVGDKVVINGQLYGDADGNRPGKNVNNKVTTITRRADGHPYPYNTTGDLGWMSEDSIKPYTPTPTPTPEPPKPEPTTLKVGDKVKIIATGKGTSYGEEPTAYGIGWEREILRIYDGRPYPYQVGNSTGTTGFYQASALQKI